MLNCDMLIDANDIKSTISKLKNEENYEILLDVTAIDYLNFSDVTPSRFAVVYILRDSTFKKHISVKAFVDDSTLEVDSLCDLFESANWAERETYDQYGIKFKGHPNLKRVLNHHQFTGHPLRKDYPTNTSTDCLDTGQTIDTVHEVVQVNKPDQPQQTHHLYRTP